MKFRIWDNTNNKYLGSYNLKSIIEKFSYGVIVSHPYISYQYDYEQFTGCKDSKGIEIYEGDILLIPKDDWWPEDTYMLVEISDKEYLEGPTIKNQHGQWRLSKYSSNRYTIVGNNRLVDQNSVFRKLISVE